MHLPRFSRYVVLVLAAALGCGGGESLAPSHEPPANVQAVSSLALGGQVGSPVSDGLVVRVTDANGRPVEGANVAFAVTAGNGSTNPRLAVTDSKGQATTVWTLGTIVGTNEVTASVTGVSTIVRFQATGAAGSVTAISLSNRNVRLLTNVDTVRIVAQALDSFGNATTPGPTFAVRDPTLVSVDASGLIRALRRGSSTYVVASAGGKSDSSLVTVLAVGQSLCTAVATPMTLSVGQVVTDLSGTGVCVHAANDGAEYAIIPFYNATVPSASIQVEVRPQGIAPLPLAAVANLSRSTSFGMAPQPTLVPDDAAEARRRLQERVEGATRLAGARDWMKANRTIIGGNIGVAVPAIGDIIKLNTNAVDYCDNPDVRTGKVVAVTDKAIILADTANPAGGFTDEEYRSIGVTFDTLVDPTDRRMFGDPTDIDGNGHVIMFFTRAVNELTASGSTSLYLGYYYQRDLLPKAGTTPCPGSNVGEMFYLLVPDPNGLVNGNKRTKSDVASYTLGTVAHEYQHLINASRRLYVNKYGTFEETWLDEGLAHIAEDVNFWASSRKSRGSNLDNTLFAEPAVTTAYNTFMLFNQRRYSLYLGRPESQSPVGFDVFDGDLYTRGAIWSFLRYAADRLGPAAEDAFWFKLVNTNASGLANLATALGTAPGPWLRDWAISVFTDDNAVGVDPRFTQPSFNMRSIVTNGGTGLAYPLFTRQLSNNSTTPLTLTAYGVSFMRFSVANGQDALLTVTSNGQPLPSAVQLAVVRVR